MTINPPPWLAALIDRLHTAALTRTDWLTGDPARTDPDD